MQEFTLEELGLFLGVAGAAVGACLIGVLHQIQKSRCRTLKCCGVECERSADLAVEEPETPPAPPLVPPSRP